MLRCPSSADGRQRPGTQFNRDAATLARVQMNSLQTDERVDGPVVLRRFQVSLDNFVSCNRAGVIDRDGCRQWLTRCYGGRSILSLGRI